MKQEILMKYLSEKLLLKWCLVGVFNWNYLDVLFTFNFDLDLILTFFQGHKDLYFFNFMPLTGTTSYSADLIDRLQLNLDNGWSDLDVFFTSG